MSPATLALTENNGIILENIITNIPQYIFWKDLTLEYVGCNQNFAELIGITDPSYIRQMTDNDIPWEQDGNTASYFRQRDIEVINGKKIFNLEQTLSINDQKIVVLLNQSPILDEEGEIIGVLGTLTDITERKRRENELFIAKQEAENVVNIKNQFLCNMQHDIRTPFNGIISAAEILKTSRNPNHKDELLDSIIQSSNALLGLLNQVVELSQSESGARPVIQKKTHIPTLINDIIHTTKLSAQLKSLDFCTDISHEIPDYLLGDQFRVQCILMNILNNAVKFTKEGFVKLSINPIKKHQKQMLIEFKIEDSGIGIPEEKYNIIFEKFTRHTPSYQGKHNGLGNGLSMVKRYIEDLDGEIDVCSTLNTGTTFTCIIPFKLTLVDQNI